MRTHTMTRNGLWNAVWAGGIALLMAGSPCWAQSAKVAEKSVQITPDAAKKELSVGFRLVNAVGVTSVSATADGVAEPLPATWEAWTDAKSKPCAWMIVVDTSNPARAKTIEACKEEVRGFLSGLPKTDAVVVYGLARDLVEVAAFDINREDVITGVSKLKADGDAAQTTLIFQNLREGLGKLSARKEPRKALLVFTDGKDETPGGATALEIEKKKFIDAAKAAGVAVHTLGYAERAADQRYFTHLKEISAETDGLHAAAFLDTRKLKGEVIPLIRDVMHGAGAVHIKLDTLEKPAALTIKAKTATGAEATLKVAADDVAKAFPKPVEPDPAKTAGKTPEEVLKGNLTDDVQKAAKDAQTAADAAEIAAEAAQKAANQTTTIAQQEPRTDEARDAAKAAQKAADEARDAAKAAQEAADKAKKIAEQKATEITREAVVAAQEAAEGAAKSADVARGAAKSADAAQEAAKVAHAAAAKKEAEDNRRFWIIIGSLALLVVAIVAFLMMRAANKRAAEEEARLAEEARRAEEARLAEEQRLAATVVKKQEEKPLAWLEMCDAQQTRHPVRISSLKIGRGSHNDFVLRNDSVSGNHCVLNRTREGMWSVTDLNSGNGVVLNGERIQQGELRHGDTIELGDIKMRFLIKG